LWASSGPRSSNGPAGRDSRGKQKKSKRGRNENRLWGEGKTTGDRRETDGTHLAFSARKQRVPQPKSNGTLRGKGGSKTWEGLKNAETPVKPRENKKGEQRRSRGKKAYTQQISLKKKRRVDGAFKTTWV